MAAVSLSVPSTAPTTAVNNTLLSGVQNYWTIQVSGTYGTLAFTVQATTDGTHWFNVGLIDLSTFASVGGGSTLSPSDNSTYAWAVPDASNFVGVQITPSTCATGTANFLITTQSVVNGPVFLQLTSSTTSFTSITTSGNASIGGTLGVTGATTLSSTLGVTGAVTLSSTLAVTGNVSVNTNKFNVTASNGNVASAGSILSSSSSGGIGYATGAGGTVTQGTSRTTGVTINTPCGQITLVSAAGSATPFSFTVSNSSVGANDLVDICQKSGTDAYSAVVTAIGAGSFKVTVTDLTGTTTEQPVFTFCVTKAVAS